MLKTITLTLLILALLVTPSLAIEYAPCDQRRACVKEISRNSAVVMVVGDQVDMAWKVRLKNICPHRLYITITFQWLNDDKFLLAESTPHQETQLFPGDEWEFHGLTHMPQAMALHVKYNQYYLLAAMFPRTVCSQPNKR